MSLTYRTRRTCGVACRFVSVTVCARVVVVLPTCMNGHRSSCLSDTTPHTFKSAPSCVAYMTPVQDTTQRTLTALCGLSVSRALSLRREGARASPVPRRTALTGRTACAIRPATAPLPFVFDRHPSMRIVGMTFILRRASPRAH